MNMEIQPNSKIYLLHNVPLDTTYDHTIYFADSVSQYNYFYGKVKHALSAQSYQRVNKGIARVGVSADDCYDCNYMMFQNTSFGHKWFYAYITSVEYVNNETAEIHFEIDPVQTWWFDFTIDYCFVEREHSYSDELFSNLVDENLDLGDYTAPWSDFYDMGQQNICLLTSKSSSGGGITGHTRCNVYTPLNIIRGISANDESSCQAVVDDFINNGLEDAIIAMYQYPSNFGFDSVSYDGKQVTMPNDIDGYVPNNKKLFSYPFNLLVVSNNCGQTAEYKWELWEQTEHRGKFMIAGCALGNPTALLYPLQYRGQVQDYASGLLYSNFPANPIVGDAFKAWWAQNKSNTIANIAASGVGAAGTALAIGAGAVTGGAAVVAGIGALAGVASVAGHAVAKKKDLERIPPQVHGQGNADYLNAGMSRCEFTFYKTCIRYQFARIIDRYFDRFGYATNLTKLPNTHSRPHWNYVKTAGATITGSLPADDARKICNILDKGVTFWKNGDEVGNYGLDNRAT